MGPQQTIIEPLRIVGLATHNSYGGAQSALRRLMDALAKRGHHAELWFIYRTRGEHETEAPNARVLLPHAARGVPGYLRAALALRRALRDGRPDALISFLPLANVLGQTIAATEGIRARIASQRNPGWTYDHPIPMLDKVAGLIGIYRTVVCVSEAVRQSFAHYPEAYRRRLLVVPNGIDLRLPEIDRAVVRRVFGLPLEGFVVAAVGRLSAQKNLTLLLDAVARALGITLALAGDGEDRAILERRTRELGIGERVVFLGKISAKSVPELLVGVDAFAQPSLFEGQSNALLEAMAAGLPILASDIPSQRETLTDDAGQPCGLLLPLDHPEEWARALQQLQPNAKEKSALGRAAANRSAAFTVERMAAGFEAVMAAACDDRPVIGARSSEYHHHEKAWPSSR
jgi:glycosyltransferase involved in cell wall biosynthesis